MAKYRRVSGIISIFGVFFLLRLYRLGFHDLWYDEICIVNYAQHLWANWNAPLYSIVLHFWINLFGITEFSLRFPSLLFSFLSILLVFLLAKKLFDKRTGLFASIIMGLSPFHLWYAQEARNYSLLLFVGLLSSYLLLKAIEERKLKTWVFFTLASIAGLYTNYFFIFLLVVQIIFLIIFSKRLKLDLRNLFPFLIISLSFLPYLSRFLSKFFSVWRGFWLPMPDIKAFLITLENFLLGYNGTFFLYILVDIVAIALFIFAFKVTADNRELKKGFQFCLVLFILPIISIFLFSRLFFSIYLDRALIIFSPYFYIILSLALVSLNRPTRTFLFSILIVLMLIGDYKYFRDEMIVPYSHHTGAFIKKPFKPIMRFVEANFQQGDIIGVTNQSPPITPSLSFYGSKNLLFYFFFYPGMIDSNFQIPIPESRVCIPFYKIDKLDFERLWVISTDGGQRSGRLCENSIIVKEWLEKNFKQEFSEEFDGLWLFRYVRS